jgi:hypothetical protein
MHWITTCPWQPALLLGLLALYLVCSAIAAVLDDLDLRRDQRSAGRRR